MCSTFNFGTRELPIKEIEPGDFESLKSQVFPSLVEVCSSCKDLLRNRIKTNLLKYVHPGAGDLFYSTFVDRLYKDIQRYQRKEGRYKKQQFVNPCHVCYVDDNLYKRQSNRIRITRLIQPKYKYLFKMLTPGVRALDEQIIKLTQTPKCDHDVIRSLVQKRNIIVSSFSRGQYVHCFKGGNGEFNVSGYLSRHFPNCSNG